MNMRSCLFREKKENRNPPAMKVVGLRRVLVLSFVSVEQLFVIPAFFIAWSSLGTMYEQPVSESAYRG